MSQTPVAPWPAMSIAQAHALLTSPGSPFEMETVEIGGHALRTWKNAPRSLATILLASRTHGERDCIVLGDERMSFEGHYRAVCTLARWLEETHGIARGDRVAIAMRNLPEWSVAFWAITACGAIVVPLNAWCTGAELAFMLADAGVRIAFTDHERLQRIMPELSALPALERLVVTRAPHEADLHGALRWEDTLGTVNGYAALHDTALPEIDIAPEDDATIFYTSGTTGKPKGALGTHRNICTNVVSAGVSWARAFLRRGEIPPAPDPAAPRKAVLLTVPFFHVTGCHSVLAPSVLAGNKIVLMHRWDADLALALMERERITGLRPDGALIAEHFYDYAADLPGDGWHASMNYAGFSRPVWGWLADPGESGEHFGLPVPFARKPGRSMVASMRDFAGRVPWQVAAAQWNNLGSHDTPRLRTRLGSMANVELAAALLFTYLGTPMLYAGDEIGATGTNGEHGRTPMPWDQATTGGPRWDLETYDVFRALSRLRRDTAALREGGLRWAVVEDDAVAYLRETPQERVLVVVARAPWAGAVLPRWVLGDSAPELLYGGSATGTPSLSVMRDGVQVAGDGPAVGVWRLA